ncbi:MAG: serine hydrolase [Bacteroidales bacterium]
MKKIILFFFLLPISLDIIADTIVSKLPFYVEVTIDSIIKNGIKDQIFPGCQVMAIHQDTVIFSKCYGYQTYDQTIPVDEHTLYDVASITKSAATTLAIMKLYDENKIKLNDTIGQYLPYLKGSDKSKLLLVELLTHTSGLPAYIPFYKAIAKNPNYLDTVVSELFSVQIADRLYLRNDYPDSIRAKIANCKLGTKKYVYSDLGFFLLKEMVENITRESLDSYLEKKFYQPLELQNTCFNPLNHGFTKKQIAPTEIDMTFRNQTIEGYVHDQTAALFNGIGGNAGLFSTAHDLGIIFQMLMNGGIYRGQSLLSPETVLLFTSTFPLHKCNHRALGFDTPSFEKPSDILPVAADKTTYGHQGFTGTVFWCDPKEKLIYIFLSNRVYPCAEPNKLSQSKIRLYVQENFYESIEF